MLALRSLGKGAEPARTLIFDEIDAGIGGRTAEAVAAEAQVPRPPPSGPLHHPSSPDRRVRRPSFPRRKVGRAVADLHDRPGAGAGGTGRGDRPPDLRDEGHRGIPAERPGDDRGLPRRGGERRRPEGRNERGSETTMNRKDRAVDLFKQGFSCSQAVAAVFAEDNGLPVATAFRIAQGFGGGMARLAETCGAVTGAFMIIGLKHGRTRPEDEAAKERTYALVQELVPALPGPPRLPALPRPSRLRHRDGRRPEGRRRREAARRSLSPARRLGRRDPGGHPLGRPRSPGPAVRV